jgi:hypothetical protein
MRWIVPSLDERERGDRIVARGATFEEWITVGIEQMAGAGGHLEIGMFAAAMNDAEQGEQLRPSTEAVVHGVRVTFGISAQPLEETTHGVVPDIKPAARQQTTILGEEDEHKAEQDGDQASIDVVGIRGGEFPQDFAMGASVCGLKTAQ